MNKGLRSRGRFDVGGAFCPSLHPGRHSTPQEESEAQALVAGSQPAQGVTTQLLVAGSQIVASGSRIAGLVQGFF
jgi:hypothetical protein